MLSTKIVHKTSTNQLDQRLKLNLKNKYVEGEHWFKHPESWYELTAFSNPYMTVYSELVLLIQNLNKIINYLSNHTLIFYGLGTGDTEMILVNSLLTKEKLVDIVGIEIQAKFIDGFVQSLQNIALNDNQYQINFKGIHGLFQEVEKDDFGSLEHKRAHIILGNTIGNFKEEQIFEIFNKLMNPKDVLLVGFQTDENMDNIFKQYSTNKMFNNFICKAIPDCKELKWKINSNESQIEAWNDDILVFHSKKKKPSKMQQSAETFGFKLLFGVNDSNSCIQIFTKE